MRHQELASRSAVTPLSQGGKQRDLWHWNQRALEPWRRGCPTRSVLWKKAVTAGPSDGVHVCVFANTPTPHSSHSPVSCYHPPLAKSKWKLKRKAAWVMGSVEASLLGAELVRGWRGIKWRLARITSQAGRGFPPCQWSVAV